MSKRSSPSSSADGSTSEPVIKRMRQVTFEPVRLCSISSVKDIDNQVLRSQHYKLCERFRHKDRIIGNLEQKVRDMEEKQNQEYSILCTVDRSWNRFDEDVRLLLQRFDAETTLDNEGVMKAESDNEFTSENHFLKVLSQLNSEEIGDKMNQRVEFSKRALAKLVQVFDQLISRNDHIAALLEDKPLKASSNSAVENELKQEEIDESTKFSSEQIEEKLRNELKSVFQENSKLQRLITNLQAENHRLSNHTASLEDRVVTAEMRCEEMSRTVEDTRFELENAWLEVNKLDYRLADVINEQKLKAESTKNIEEPVKMNGINDEQANITKKKLEELEKDLEIRNELAANRLSEIDELTNRNKELAADLERKTMELKYLPSSTIRETPDYKSLHTQYTSLYDECRQLRQQADDFRKQIINLNEAHAKQLEFNESEEAQARLRNAEEILSLQETLNLMKSEYENLRLEFEQNLAARDQSDAADKEYRALNNSFALQNKQLKEETARFKRKWKDAVNMLARSQKELEAERKYRETCIIIELHEEPQEIKSPDAHGNNHTIENSDSLLRDSDEEEGEELNSDEMNLPIEHRHEKLITKLRKRIANLKLKLEIVKNLGSDERERFDLLVKERRLVQERDTLKETLRKLTSNDKKEKARYYSEDAKKRIRSLDELCEKLRKDLANAKQEEEGLMNEMESTGQAFEETIEQNARVAQQLKEKEEANLRLMSELIKASHAQKKSKEERDISQEQITALQHSLEAQQLLSQRLQEKERVLLQKTQLLEQELTLKDQAVESHKRKAVESSQSSIDLKLQLEKMTTQLNETQEAVSSKASSIEVLATKIKRLEEDKKKWKSKYDRAKKIEQFENVDQLLEEENRILKADLTCPSCKVNRKNAIFTKCFHMFCFDCIKQLYDCRRRRCPKCNAGFGANDYRRVYINT
uniref:E3 ubiquitin protein ligase n=1 Tax=Acrobeloides nanus TaxID=290746 RepID=A0A914DRV9_9BILA